MGIHYAPLYGELDLGSALEEYDKIVAKIKSNKYDAEDLSRLAKIAVVIKEKSDEELLKNEQAD